jgi:hypothetical protein
VCNNVPFFQNVCKGSVVANIVRFHEMSIEDTTTPAAKTMRPKKKTNSAKKIGPPVLNADFNTVFDEEEYGGLGHSYSNPLLCKRRFVLYTCNAPVLNDNPKQYHLLSFFPKLD